MSADSLLPTHHSGSVSPAPPQSLGVFKLRLKLASNFVGPVVVERGKNLQDVPKWLHTKPPLSKRQLGGNDKECYEEGDCKHRSHLDSRPSIRQESQQPAYGRVTFSLSVSSFQERHCEAMT